MILTNNVGDKNTSLLNSSLLIIKIILLITRVIFVRVKTLNHSGFSSSSVNFHPNFSGSRF